MLDALEIEHGFGLRRAERVLPPGLLYPRQVHGARVMRVPPLPPDAQADALVTDAPGIAVGVFTADCVPILIAGSGGGGVATVHAGWRGSALRVAEVAARTLAEALQCHPGTLVAAIGPHIGPCCYEVDGPVHTAVGDDSVFTESDRPGHYRLDLFELNRRHLLAAGLRPERIDRVEGCTACDLTRFYSYRREGHTGRLPHYVRCPPAKNEASEA
jgi:YfiH family protein